MTTSTRAETTPYGLEVQPQPALVSVIMPCYNHERYVAEAIESVIGQTYSRVQLILVNDGSSDGTGEVIQSLMEGCRERFEHFEYLDQSNQGIVAALNNGLRLVAGEFVCTLASDDRFAPEKIGTLVAAFRQLPASVDVVFGDARFIDSDGQDIAIEGPAGPSRSFVRYHIATRRVPLGVMGSYTSLLSSNYVPAMSTLIRSRILDEVGGFGSGGLLEDWPLWLKLARRSNLAFVDEVVADYRRHGSNLTSVAKLALDEETVQCLLGERSYCLQDPELYKVWMDSYAARVVSLILHGGLRSALKAVREVRTTKLIRHIVRVWWQRASNWRTTKRRYRVADVH